MAMQTMDKSIEQYRIPEIRALKRQSNNVKAKQILDKIADQVLPIMVEYKWKVRRLHEFFPRNAGLLGMNVNRGMKIYVRLRPANRPESFYPYTEVLGTMLHELVHMRIGPHNAEFYKLLDELKLKTELLIMKGLTGEVAVGFHSAGDGKTLGGRKYLRGTDMRKVSLTAAVKRRQYQSLVNSGGRRLNDSINSENSGQHHTDKETKTKELGRTAVLSPKSLRLRALEAAEKRRHDNESCLAVLDGLSLEDKHLNDVECLSDSSNSTTLKGKQRSTRARVELNSSLRTPQKEKSVEQRCWWQCSLCTLLNDAKSVECDACGQRKEISHKDYNPTLVKGKGRHLKDVGFPQKKRKPVEIIDLSIDEEEEKSIETVPEPRSGVVQTETEIGLSTHWVCTFCTFINVVIQAVNKCSVCGAMKAEREGGGGGGSSMEVIVID